MLEISIDKSGFDLLMGISNLALDLCPSEHESNNVRTGAYRGRRLC